MVWSNSSPTGGDTLSHYTAFVYFNDHILPNLRLWGWNQGNLAGFSQFELYFPLPFLVTSFLGLFMPLPIAFKLCVLLPAFALPFCTYLCLRLLRAHFPGAILGAVFSLCFLLVEDNCVWGGNLASLLAGEFCYGFGFCLSLVYLGSLTWWLKGRSGVVAPSLLLMAVGLCHVYSLLFCLAASMFAISVRSDRQRAALRLFTHYLLAFLLLGFWIIPYTMSGAHSELFNCIRGIDNWHEYLPHILWPLLLLAPVGLALSYFRGDLNDKFRANYLLGWSLTAIALFLLSPFLNTITVRFAPFAQFSAIAITACGIGVALKNQSYRGLIACAVIVMALAWPWSQVGNLPNRFEANSISSESMDIGPDLAAMYEKLSGHRGDSRIIYEPTATNKRIGPDRVFESLPHWTSRPTLKGLYIQASPNSPFIYYLQSEISHNSSTPLPLYHYCRQNLQRALEHMALYNVGHFITRDPRTIHAAEATPGFELFGEFGAFKVFTLSNCPGHYGVTPQYKPVAVVTQRPQFIAYQWFRFTDLKTPLVFFDSEGEVPPNRFAAILGDDGTRKSKIIQSIRHDNLPRLATRQNVRIQEGLGPQSINLSGLKPGQPVWISISYDRGWRSTSGETINRASPAFMLVYPKGESIRLVHGPTWPHWLGLALTIIGAVLGLLISISPLRLERPLSRLSNLIGRRPIKRWLFFLLGSLLTGGIVCLWWSHDDAQTMHNKATLATQAGQWERARKGFCKVLAQYDMSSVGDSCLYDMALTFYTEQNYGRAIDILLELIEDYPDSVLVPETLYHLADSYKSSGDKQMARRYGGELVERFPQNSWTAKWKSKQ